MTNPVSGAVEAVADWCEGRDAWQDEIERRYPKAISSVQFEALTLESGARHPEGICWPPQIADGFRHYSMLLGMDIRGLIERKNVGYSTPVEPYVITDKGRAAALTQMGAE